MTDLDPAAQPRSGGYLASLIDPENQATSLASQLEAASQARASAEKEEKVLRAKLEDVRKKLDTALGRPQGADLAPLVGAFPDLEEPPRAIEPGHATSEYKLASWVTRLGGILATLGGLVAVVPQFISVRTDLAAIGGAIAAIGAALSGTTANAYGKIRTQRKVGA